MPVSERNRSEVVEAIIGALWIEHDLNSEELEKLLEPNIVPHMIRQLEEFKDETHNPIGYLLEKAHLLKIKIEEEWIRETPEEKVLSLNITQDNKIYSFVGVGRNKKDAKKSAYAYAIRLKDLYYR
jgi:dsRNA-specific ribonuclease